MKKIPKVTYRSVDELDCYITRREADANRLPPGEQRQTLLKEVARLRIYADVKRLLTPAAKAAT
jgi:hypothetical protein